MSYGLAIVTPPASEPLTLAEAKAHLRIDHADQDGRINGLIRAAREYVERHTGRQLMQAEWNVTFDRFPCSSAEELRLPLWPVQSISSIKYLDAAGVEQTWSSASYTAYVAREPAIIRPSYGNYWPSTRDEPGAVRVRQVSGYASAAAIPEIAKQVMYLLIGHWDEHREAVVTGGLPAALQLSVESLLSLLSAGEC